MTKPLCVAVFVVLTACGDPSGGWEVVAEADQTAMLDTNVFEATGDASATFTLPELREDGIAFYRFEVSFTRGGSAIDAGERVLVRVIPRFQSFDGTNEQTNFLRENDDGIFVGRLIAQGSLERCDGSESCLRDITVTTGWLAPPPAGATLALDIGFDVELRGSGVDEPPAQATASATLSF